MYILQHTNVQTNTHTTNRISHIYFEIKNKIDLELNTCIHFYNYNNNNKQYLVFGIFSKFMAIYVCSMRIETP